MAKRDGFDQKKFGICDMKRISSFIVLFLIPLSLFSQEWKFEVDSLRDDGPIVPLVLNPLIDGILPEVNYSDYDNGIDSTKVINGFRVQVLSTQNGDIAEEMRMELISQMNHNVRVIFDAPNYKVRVGAFTDRNDADRLRKQLYALGHHRAWIVRARFTLKDS